MAPETTKKPRRMKRFLVIFLVICAVLVSGCTTKELEGYDNQTYAGEDNADQSSASLKQALELYNGIQTDLSAFNSKLSEMQSKGVDTIKTEQQHTSFTNEFDSAVILLYSANNAHQSKNYDTALSYASQAVSRLQSLRDSFSQLYDSLEQDYEHTVDRYKTELKDAKKQYNEAKFYVDEIGKGGIDVTSTQTTLQNAYDTLKSVEELFQQGQFSGLDSQLNDIKSMAKNIKDEATDLYFNSITQNKIEEASSFVQTSEATVFLELAGKKTLEKRYSEAIADVNKALLTEIRADINGNMEKVRDFSKSNKLDIFLVAPEAELERVQEMISVGQFERASQSMVSVKDSLNSYIEAVAKVANSGIVVEGTEKLAFCWIESPDVDKTDFQKAKQMLAEGNAVGAITHAETAIEEARKNQQEFWRKVKKDWICGFLLSMARMLGNPEEFEVIPVERPLLEYKDSHELVVIDFSKPPVDVGMIEITEPQPPSFDRPAVSQPPEETVSKKPIDFHIDEGNPRYDYNLITGNVNCETTATITNTGDETAHNAYAELKAYSSSSDSSLKINGNPSFRKYIGDLAGGQPHPENVNIVIGCLPGCSECLQGLDLVLTVTSNEKTKDEHVHCDTSGKCS